MFLDPWTITVIVVIIAWMTIFSALIRAHSRASKNIDTLWDEKRKLDWEVIEIQSRMYTKNKEK